MQFLPCAWGPGVATTRSERCESKTRPALETLPSAFSVSLYSHTPFSSHFGSWPFCPPSFKAWPLHLFCSVFFPVSFWEDSFSLTRAPREQDMLPGRPWSTWAGDIKYHQPPETFQECCPARLQLHLHLIE